MKKIYIFLALGSFVLLSSGFGATENNTYVRSEVKTNNEELICNQNGAVQNPLREVDVIEEEFIETDVSKSISERLGNLLVSSVQFIVKSIGNFILSLFP